MNFWVLWLIFSRRNRLNWFFSLFNPARSLTTQQSPHSFDKEHTHTHIHTHTHHTHTYTYTYTLKDHDITGVFMDRWSCSWPCFHRWPLGVSAWYSDQASSCTCDWTSVGKSRLAVPSWNWSGKPNQSCAHVDTVDIARGRLAIGFGPAAVDDCPGPKGAVPLEYSRCTSCESRSCLQFKQCRWQCCVWLCRAWYLPGDDH